MLHDDDVEPAGQVGEDEQHTWSARLVYPDMVQPSKTFLSLEIGQLEAMMMTLPTMLVMVERMFCYSSLITGITL